MRLHSLSLAGIGPFREPVEIDFARVGADGFFLMEGPTGSGKSTIIDAVTFALYGKVAGDPGGTSRLPSQLVDADCRPTVELIFNVPCGWYRVTRSPRFVRPKTRGSGHTSQVATASLWQVALPRHTPPPTTGSNEWKLISARLTEVDSEIQRLVGLSHDQFIQTVVLPQGRFSGFLNATPSDRTTILRSLFATDVYDLIAEELMRRSTEARVGCDEARHVFDKSLALFQSAVGIGETHAEVLSAMSREDVPAAIVEACAELDTQVDGLRAVLREARASSDTADKTLASARDRTRELDRHTDASRQLRVLDEQAADHRLRLKQAHILRRLVDTKGLRAEAAQAKRERANAEHAWSTVRDRLPQGLRADPPSLSATHDTMSDKCLTLTQRLQLTKDLAHCVEKANEQSRDRDQATAAAADLQRQKAGLAAILDSLDNRIAATRDGGTDVKTEERRYEEAGHVAAAARKFADLLTEKETCRESRDKAVEEARLAAAAADDLRQLFADGVAGRLANELADGEGCPVCGSTTHPKPAPVPRDAVTVEQVQRAEARCRVIREDADAAEAQLRDIGELLLTAAAQARDLTVEQSEEQLNLKRSRLAATRVRARELEDCELDRAKRLHELALVDGALVKHQREEAAATEALKVLSEQAGRLRDGLGSASPDPDTIAAQLTEARATLAAVSEAKEAYETLAAAIRTASEADDRFARSIKDLNIESPRELAMRVSELERLPKLERDIQSYEDQRAAAKSVLEDPLVIAAANAPRPDLKALEDESSRRRDNYERCIRQHQRWTQRKTEAHRTAERVRASTAHLQRIEQDSEAIVRLADLVSGKLSDNREGTPLQTYVLISRFRAVVAAANERLRQMSDGRYEFEHHRERQGLARKTGLGLRIRDLRTERFRETATLSGGETFYAALALALGLADVVTAEAGGRAIGTLFIDEGFGGLDGATLDQVLGEVERLRNADRVVGIVSHVAELKQRIPDRIEVHPNGDGSSRVILVP